jgi:GT2 family glycosyltransferase
MEKIVSCPPVCLSLSVVSHGQLGLIIGLMKDIQTHCANLNLELILTINVDEPLNFQCTDFSYPIHLVHNQVPKGFGANHNQAFDKAIGAHFCVLNPDIRFVRDPFSNLLECLKKNRAGVVAPLVYSDTNELEDSFRHFPDPWTILKKMLGIRVAPDYPLTAEEIEPDWVGGMCMVFARQVFQSLRGFDENYYLYYEDVDLCGRLRLAGYRVVVCTSSRVIHHARRSSHRNMKYLLWHITSMFRFFLSPVYRQLQWRQGK